MILKMTTRVHFEDDYWFTIFIEKTSLNQMLLSYAYTLTKNPDFKLDLVI